MKNFSIKNWPMALKFGTTPAILILVILCFGYAFYYSSNKLIATTDVIVQHDMAGASEISSINTKVYALNSQFFEIMTEYASGRSTPPIQSVLKPKAQIIVDGLQDYNSRYVYDQATKDEIDVLIGDIIKYYVGTDNDGIFDVAGNLVSLDVGMVLDGLENYKKTYNALTTTMDKLVLKTLEKSNNEAAHSKNTSEVMLVQILTIAAIVLFGVVLLAFYIGVSTVKSINQIANATLKLADGDNDVDIEVLVRGDELKGIVNSLRIFKENQQQMLNLQNEQEVLRKQSEDQRKQAMLQVANDFESSVGVIVRSVSESASSIQDISVKLSDAAVKTSRESDSVNTAAQNASHSVQTVAAAAEQMSASVQEISRSINKTAETAQLCTEAANLSQQKLDQLQDSMSKVDTVIQSISDVAEQTNLLALNATIEAARAGDAGKGFAVVANEVKQLATETRKMTDEISERLSEIKSSADDTIISVNDIIKQISEVNSRTTNIASAIEEQNSATSEISHSATEAASSTSNVTRSMSSIQEAANDSSTSTELLQSSSHGLSARADELRASVDKFLDQVRNS